MPDLAKRLIGPIGVPGNFTTLYTVPNGVTAVMRYMRLLNTTPNDVQFVLSVGPDAVGSRIFDLWVPGDQASLEWSGFIPLTEGETLVATGTTANVLTLLVAGLEMT